MAAPLRPWILIAALTATLASNAQLPVPQWVAPFDAHNTTNFSDGNNARTIGVDPQGNVYSAGLFEHTVDFDPGPGLYTLTADNTFETGIYISKLDANGHFVWAKHLPVLVEFGSIELKVDGSGNVYLASNIPYAADMDPGPGVNILNPIGPKDAFVIKLDTDGNLVWVKHFGGPGDTIAEANAIDIADNGDVLICGLFNNTVDFDPGPGTHNLTSSSHIQTYIVRLNNNGEFIWVEQFGNSPVLMNASFVTDVKFDHHGNICLVGGFSGNCDFDPGPGVFNMQSRGLIDGFIAKLDGVGNFRWAKWIGNTTLNYDGVIYSRGIDIDAMDNIVNIGAFEGAIDFDPGPGTNIVQSVSSTYDWYILKLDPQGETVWARIFGNTGSDEGNDLAIDSDNNIYAIGDCGASVDFDPGPGQYIIDNPGYGAAMLLKLSSAGNFVYAGPFPAINSGSSLFRRMDIDTLRNLYVTGTFSGELDFDPGPNEYPAAAGSNGSPFVLKLSRCANVTRSTLLASGCNSYTLNDQTYDSSGTYTQVLLNQSGCDSIITLQLTLNKKFTQQAKTICQGEYFYAGGTNQTISGTYRDTLMTVGGCDSIITTLLTVNPTPLPNLGADRDLCSNTQLMVTPGSFRDYLWHDLSNENSFTIHVPGAYWVTVTNDFNCSASDTIIIGSLLPLPSGFLKEKDSVCSFESIKIGSTQAYVSYQWSTGETERNITVQQPGLYWLLVNDANGCTGTDSITVSPKLCPLGVFIPTSFTPNGDGKNDIFKPLVYGLIKRYRFVVYNRWGAKVFETTDPQRGWDGRVGGIPQSSSVFVWTCVYQLEGGPSKNEKGVVTLVQ